MTGSEIVVAIVGFAVLLHFFFRFRRYVKKRAAAFNIVAAKATFESLSETDRDRVHKKTVDDLTLMMGGRFHDFNGEFDRFGCYAHSMARLGIQPIIPGYDRWFMVKNPFTVISPRDPLIAETALEMKRKYGIDVVLSPSHRVFDLLSDGSSR